jgi:FeoA domain
MLNSLLSESGRSPWPKHAPIALNDLPVGAMAQVVSLTGLGQRLGRSAIIVGIQLRLQHRSPGGSVIIQIADRAPISLNPALVQCIYVSPIGALLMD